MAPLAAITYGAVLISFAIGNLWRPTVWGISWPMIDLCLVLLSFWLFFFTPKQPKNYLLILFLFSSFVNLLVQSLITTVSLPPLLYWLRFSLWFYFISQPAIKLIPSKLFLPLVGIFLITGLVQYFFYPYLGPLTVYNWDPHLYRLVGSLLDPAFTGICLLLLLIFLFTSSHFRFRLPLIILTYVALSLAYSRATFLALVITAAYYAHFRQTWNIFFKTVALVGLTLILLPRPSGEGTKLERTSTIQAKIVNYQQALKLHSQHPLFGIGYNRIGFFRTQEKPTSHARWGFDNSFLNLLIGNGLPLFLLFTYLFWQLWYKSGPDFRFFLLPVIVHSFFSNTLVYPYVMFLLLAFKYRR